mmetsp:Transcript_26948/g.26028  ORF Transcript_26948/g.26028 Transcript_26948/m.26028 type:complete len:93 (+) Transcript_26948:1053-1331(+)
MIGYIDSVLNDFHEEDPDFLDYKRYSTTDSNVYNDEIQKMKDQEEEENKKRMRQFQELIDESKIDIQVDNMIDDEERVKIEKVKKLLEKKEN